MNGSAPIRLADITGDAASRSVADCLERAAAIAEQAPELTRCVVLLADGDGSLVYCAAGIRLLDGLGLLRLADRAILDDWAEGDDG